MRYFDSPKNRALWERELTVLRRRRAQREAGGYEAPVREELQPARENGCRIRVTYEELLKMEAESMEAERGQRKARPVRKEKERAAERSRER